MKQLDRDYNDYEILEYIANGSEEAMEIMYQKYDLLVKKYANHYYKASNNLGLEYSDFIQEGMIGLALAIQSYKTKKNTLFYTYASTCIERRLISSIIRAKRQKHKILNSSLSLDEEQADSLTLSNMIADTTSVPEEIILENENEEELKKFSNDNLTDLEKQVFELKINGFSYKEISSVLDRDLKTIDNAVQRIRRKFKKYNKEV